MQLYVSRKTPKSCIETKSQNGSTIIAIKQILHKVHVPLNEFAIPIVCATVGPGVAS